MHVNIAHEQLNLFYHLVPELYGQEVCRHNYMLHADPKPAGAGGSVSGSANVVVTQASGSLGSKKLLMTCQVMATGPSGRAMPVRGLLDSGAEVSVCMLSFISLSLYITGDHYGATIAKYEWFSSY